MKKKKILYIGGSLNQTTIMHKISGYLSEFDNYFTPYYADGNLDFLAQKGILDFTVLGGEFRKSTLDYLNKHHLAIDIKGENHDYDLIFTCQDLIVQNNIRGKKVVLVQEGMTDPKNIFYYAAKYLGFPRWLASTSTTGLSNSYQYFCVASEGYKELFSSNGIDEEKIIPTGIPNFDNCKQYLNNDFPYQNYVMVATSDSRETVKYENRKKFIKYALNIADGRQLLFKFHPNERFERAIHEVEKYAPGSLIFTSGNTNHMIANSDVLITKYSSVVYVGLALGKEVYSAFDLDQLKKLMPIQNNGVSAERISRLGRLLLNTSPKESRVAMLSTELAEA